MSLASVRRLSAILITLGLALMAGFCAAASEEKPSSRVAELSANQRAFLAGAVLGDNAMWITAGCSLSVEKQVLFQRTLTSLGLPEKEIAEAARSLRQSAESAQSGNLLAARDSSDEAQAKIIQSIRSAKGEQASHHVRFGSCVMLAAELAQTAEQTFCSDPSNALMTTGRSLAVLSQLAESDIERATSGLHLSKEVTSRIDAVREKARPVIATAEQAIGVRQELARLLTLYDLKPLTQIEVKEGKVRLEDAALDSVDQQGVVTGRELASISKRLDDAGKAIVPFDTEKIWSAYLAISDVLSKPGLEKADPKLAARAHRLMAGVYVCAEQISRTPSTRLGQSEAERSVIGLGEGGWRKAGKDLEKSLRQDPTQPDAEKLKKYMEALKGDSIGMGQYFDILMLLVPALSQKQPPVAEKQTDNTSAGAGGAPVPAHDALPVKLTVTNGDTLTSTTLEWGNRREGWFGYGFMDKLNLRQGPFEVNVPIVQIRDATLLWGEAAQGHKYSDPEHKQSSQDEGYIIITRTNGRTVEGLFFHSVYGTPQIAFFRGRDGDGNEFTIEVRQVERVEFPSRPGNVAPPGPPQAVLTLVNGDKRMGSNVRWNSDSRLELQRGPVNLYVPFAEIRDARFLWGKDAGGHKYSAPEEQFRKPGYLLVEKTSGTSVEGAFSDHHGGGLGSFVFNDADGNELSIFVTQVQSIRFLKAGEAP
ncbi:MAG TPA: hypothetical protein VNA25_20750 [Phycisphaerae bacterium]|nr:hypothetical protein [Phycisphaerae bacterium]